MTRVFASLGVHKVRLTGGEPLLRHGLHELVRDLSTVDGVDEIAMTTNGLLLRRHAHELREAGLDRVTVSLDTLRPERAHAFSRTMHHADTIDGIRAAREAGFQGTKLNTVVIRGFNDDEVTDLLEFSRAHGAESRFIEYMDVGGATQWSMDEVVSREQMLAAIAQKYGAVEALQDGGPAPAERYRLAGWTHVRDHRVDHGAVLPGLRPEPGDGGRDVAPVPLRRRRRRPAGSTSGVVPSDTEIADRIRERWQARTDRGAEARLADPDRGVLYQVEGLRADPRREMHTRGG